MQAALPDEGDLRSEDHAITVEHVIGSTSRLACDPHQPSSATSQYQPPATSSNQPSASSQQQAVHNRLHQQLSAIGQYHRPAPASTTQLDLRVAHRSHPDACTDMDISHWTWMETAGQYTGTIRQKTTWQLQVHL